MGFPGVPATGDAVALETANDKTIATANSTDFIACSRCVLEVRRTDALHAPETSVSKSSSQFCQVSDTTRDSVAKSRDVSAT